MLKTHLVSKLGIYFGLEPDRNHLYVFYFSGKLLLGLPTYMFMQEAYRFVDTYAPLKCIV